jgi:hypothetical protein
MLWNLRSCEMPGGEITACYISNATPLLFRNPSLNSIFLPAVNFIHSPERRLAMIAIHENPLSRLSDSQLIKRLDALVQKEREITLEVIRHLIEMDHRKLYLGIGYCSLFQFCTRSLGYSESAAGRRIKAARCIRDFPEVYEMLSKNELNLSVVCKLADILTEENKHELFTKVSHRSIRKVDEIVSRYRPESALRDSVKTVFIQKPVDTPVNPDPSGKDAFKNASSLELESGAENQNESTGKSDQNLTADVGGRTFTTCKSKYQQATILEKKYKLEFAVEPECMKKLDEAKAILSRKYPKGVPLGKLLEEALDVYLDKHSSVRKKKRREKREARQRQKKNEKQGKISCSKQVQEAKTKKIRTNKPEAERSRNRGSAYREDEEYKIIKKYIP